MDSKRIKWSVEKRKLSDLKPYDKNPRIITEEGLDQLKRSFDEIGYAQPINVNIDGTILSGHARVKQLLREGLDEVDCMVPNQLLTPKQEEAVIIRMNKNIIGSWDMDKLINEFEFDDLVDWGFNENDLKINDNWESDIGKIEKIPENSDGIKAKIKISCSMDDKDALLIFLKGKLMETSFAGVHIE